MTITFSSRKGNKEYQKLNFKNVKEKKTKERQ